MIELMANYSTAAAAYCFSVAELEEGMITGSRQVFAARRRSAEEARAICEAALKELDDHVSERHCGR